MFETIKDLFAGVVTTSDRRKKEHGSLADIKRRSMNKRKRALGHNKSITNTDQRNAEYLNKLKMRNSRRGKVGKPPLRGGYMNSVDIKPDTKESRARMVLNAVKSIFSNEDQTLMNMASTDINKLLRNQGYDKNQENLKDSILRSNAFKKKVTELEYNKRMLRDLRRSGVSGNYNIIRDDDLEEDRYLLLQKKCQKIKKRLHEVEQELKSVQDSLRYSQEMNALLQETLDKANIDDAYLKSRRQIKNLQKENVLPERELSPSPRRPIDPLFTSSPVRKSRNGEENGSKPKTDYKHSPIKETSNFYDKYPKLPETEQLAQDKGNHSLSPIRIDYSRYSS